MPGQWEGLGMRGEGEEELRRRGGGMRTAVQCKIENENPPSERVVGIKLKTSELRFKKRQNPKF